MTGLDWRLWRFSPSPQEAGASLEPGLRISCSADLAGSRSGKSEFDLYTGTLN